MQATTTPKPLFEWIQTSDSLQVEEILMLIEPEIKERTAILNCFDAYNCYVCMNLEHDKRIDAICITIKLPKTDTLHIEDFALHPRIRGKGYAKGIWELWLYYYGIDDSTAISIEVYLYNIKAWEKIMNVKVLDIPTTPLYYNEVEIQWMGKNLKYSIQEIVQEWTDIQERNCKINRPEIEFRMNLQLVLAKVRPSYLDLFMGKHLVSSERYFQSLSDCLTRIKDPCYHYYFYCLKENEQELKTLPEWKRLGYLSDVPDIDIHKTYGIHYKTVGKGSTEIYSFVMKREDVDNDITVKIKITDKLREIYRVLKIPMIVELTPGPNFDSRYDNIITLLSLP